MSTPQLTPPADPATAPPKRPAEDPIDPPDKQAKAAKMSRPSARNSAIPGEDKGSSASGFLSQIASHHTGPHPIKSTETVTVNSSDMSIFFAAIRTCILNLLYPDGRYQSAGVITEANWILVCRYYMIARIHAVYSACTGRRKDGRIPVPSAVPLPAALAQVINAIGSLWIAARGLHVVPEPEDPATDPASRVQNQVSFTILQQFERLVMAANQRGYIRIDTISRSVEGTAWWLVTARSPSNPTTICDGNDDAVLVESVFPEFTPADAYMCAIVQRKNDGLFETSLPHLMWSFDPITGVASLRTAFCTNA